MPEPIIGVVIPCGPNRLENLIEVLKSLSGQIGLSENKLPVVVVADGFGLEEIHALEEIVFDICVSDPFDKLDVCVVEQPKHVGGSGTMQPKNRGAQHLGQYYNVDYVWFLDSDIIVGMNTYQEFIRATEFSDFPRIMIGPYEWLAADERFCNTEVHNDPRWAMFNEFGPDYTSVGEINFALANFGGNIMYPMSDFKRVGGFWDDLSAGRVEDGEMGLRCASMGVPMCVVPKARGYHLEHEVNVQHKLDTNAIEVPMINKRYPEVEGEGIIMVEEDGRRFNYLCPKCGESVNTYFLWEHQASHNE